MLRLKPISLRDANEYVRKYHRHHKPVAGHKFSIGCEADGELVGIIIAGRPVSRYLDDGFTLEVTRLLCLTPLWEAAQPAWLPHRWGVISSASS